MLLPMMSVRVQLGYLVLAVKIMAVKIVHSKNVYIDIYKNIIVCHINEGQIQDGWKEGMGVVLLWNSQFFIDNKKLGLDLQLFILSGSAPVVAVQSLTPFPGSILSSHLLSNLTFGWTVESQSHSGSPVGYRRVNTTSFFSVSVRKCV